MEPDAPLETRGRRWGRRLGTCLVVFGILALPGALLSAATAIHFLMNASAYADHGAGHSDPYLNAYFLNPLGVAPLRLAKATLCLVPLWAGLLLRRGASRHSWRDLLLIVGLFLLASIPLSFWQGYAIIHSEGVSCLSNVRELTRAMGMYVIDRP